MRVRGSHVAVCSFPSDFELLGAVVTYDSFSFTITVTWTHAGSDPPAYTVTLVNLTHGFIGSQGLSGSALSADFQDGDSSIGDEVEGFIYALDSCGAVRATFPFTGTLA